LILSAFKIRQVSAFFGKSNRNTNAAFLWVGVLFEKGLSEQKAQSPWSGVLSKRIKFGANIRFLCFIKVFVADSPKK
jgi:hypothetical protein